MLRTTSLQDHTPSLLGKGPGDGVKLWRLNILMTYLELLRVQSKS